MIRNIVFDMGNVLMRYDPMLPCLRHAGNEEDAQTIYEAVFGSTEWVTRMDKGTIEESDYIKLVQSRLSSPRLKELVTLTLADWTLDGLYPITGMDWLVAQLHEHGCKLYVLSNMSVRFREIEYKLPNYKLFEGALVSAEEKLIKPDPAIFMRLCQKFSLKPEECLFIDDVQRNVEGAESVGMKGYRFDSYDVRELYEYIMALLAV